MTGAGIEPATSNTEVRADYTSAPSHRQLVSQSRI